MSPFSNAHGFTINDGNFTNVAGNLNNYNFFGRNGREEEEEPDLPRRGEGLKILYKKALTGAAYDAGQRFPPPKCHPGTRTHILRILRRWIRDSSRSTSVYWLYGAAGVGKSAIAQTLSEEFSDSCLAASFFFSRADPTRNNLTLFFVTLAQQLATSPTLGPLFRDSIDLTMRLAQRLPRGILEYTLERQLKELIMLPCSQLSPEQWKTLPHLIVIDGLDECIDIASQEHLIALIREAKSRSMPLPFDFLFCSRPEPRIRNAFKDRDFQLVLDSLDTGGESEPDGDIAKFLAYEFRRIREGHRQTMAHSAEDWPGDRVIQQLVHKACGQFVYATTVIKYIGDYYGLPTERLEIVLSNTVPEHYDSPYPDLDLLYTQILSSCKEKEKKLFLEVLGLIINSALLFRTHSDPETSSAYPSPLTHKRVCSDDIEDLFLLPRGKVGTLLFGLHSVLVIPEDPQNEIIVRHASFGDFLTDKKRSESFFIDAGRGHESIAVCLLKHLSLLSTNQRGHMKSKFDSYALELWHAHCGFVTWGTGTPSPTVLAALEQVDLCGVLNATVQHQVSNLAGCTVALKRSLEKLDNIARWAKDAKFSALFHRYSLFKHGFRVVLTMPHTPNSQYANLPEISILKYNLAFGEDQLPASFRTEALSFLLDGSLKPGQVREALSSPWSCPMILPLDNSGEHASTSGLNHINTAKFKPQQHTISVVLADCHKEIWLKCLEIFQQPTSNADLDFFAQSQWAYLLAMLRASPKEYMQTLQKVVSRIQNSGGVRQAFAIVERSTLPTGVHYQIYDILDKRMQELLKEEHRR